MGRIYVLAGVYPAVIGALLLLFIWPEQPINEFSDVLATLLWLATTTIAFVLARQHRFADHRRWMLRSFALTASFTVTLILVIPVGLILRPELHSQFAGNKVLMEQVQSGMTIWLSWILPLLAVDWWLDREQMRRSGQRRPEVERRHSVAVKS
jgi:predicted PurR-regulated permease PerM